MSLRSGLATQLGLATETTWGVYKVPDHFYELVSESLKLDRTRTEAKGIRPAKTVQRSQRFRTTKYMVNGDFDVEVQSNSFGLIFKHMLGSASSVADGAGFKRTYTIGDLYGLSLTAQVGTPDVGGTVRPRSYLGCKVDTWNLDAKLDSVLALKVSLDGAKEDTVTALAAASWPAAAFNEVFYTDEVTLTIAGSSFNAKDIALTGKNSLKTDRFFIGNQQKSQQIGNAYVDINGTMTAEFNDLTVYNYFTTDDTATGNIVITCLGQKNYDTAKPNKIIITIPSVRYDGSTPNVSGPDVVTQTVPFSIMDNDSAQPIQIDYYTADSAD